MTVELENAKKSTKNKEELAAKEDKIKEKYFYKNKAAQKAQAYINTFQAAVSAYAAMAAIPVVGPVLGAIAAAAAIVAGLANVKKIDAQTYQSSSAGGGSSAPASNTLGRNYGDGGMIEGSYGYFYVITGFTPSSPGTYYFITATGQSGCP